MTSDAATSADDPLGNAESLEAESQENACLVEPAATGDATTQQTVQQRRRFHWSLAMALAALFILFFGQSPIYFFGIFDTLTNFRWQAVFFCICLAVYQHHRRRRMWAGVILTFSAIAALPLVSLYFPASQPEPGATKLRILTLNVLQSNQEYARVVQLIRDTNADVVNLVEFSPVWEDELSEVLRDYPWHVGPINGNIVYSKLPAKRFAFSNPFFGPVKYLAASATLEIDGQPVLIVNTHPTSPTSLPRLLERDGQIGLLATPVSHLPEWYHVVMVGDFNATTSCRSVRAMMKTTGFRDTRQGFGTQSSWPTPFWPLAICIDHAFVSEGVYVHDRRTGPNVGSDHLPVILELSFDKHPSVEPEKTPDKG